MKAGKSAGEFVQRDLRRSRNEPSITTNSCHVAGAEVGAEVILDAVENGGGELELRQWCVPSGGTRTSGGFKDGAVVVVEGDYRKGSGATSEMRGPRGNPLSGRFALPSASELA